MQKFEKKFKAPSLKFKAPSPKRKVVYKGYHPLNLGFGILNLGFICNLEIEIWDFNIFENGLLSDNT